MSSRRCETEADHALRDFFWEHREEVLSALAERPRPRIIDKIAASIGAGDERTSGGAPLDPDEAELLAALRARGMNELAKMALYCFGDACGHASTALKELNAARGQSVRMEVIDGGVAPFPELSPPSPAELAQHSWLVKLAGMMGSEERRKAAERVAQLQPAAQAFFSERRFSATAREIRSWYLGQGVEVGVTIAAGEIVLDPVKLRAVE